MSKFLLSFLVSASFLSISVSAMQPTDDSEEEIQGTLTSAMRQISREGYFIDLSLEPYPSDREDFFKNVSPEPYPFEEYPFKAYPSDEEDFFTKANSLFQDIGGFFKDLSKDPAPPVPKRQPKKDIPKETPTPAVKKTSLEESSVNRERRIIELNLKNVCDKTLKSSPPVPNDQPEMEMQPSSGIEFLTPSLFRTLRNFVQDPFLVLSNNQFHDLMEITQKTLRGPRITQSLLLRCPNIQRLDLANNEKICYVPPSTTLIELNIPNNFLIFDMNLSKLTTLKTLNLSCNQWITEGSLSLLTNLTSLDLSYNSKITDKSVRLLTNLKTLNLYGTKNITGRSLSLLTDLRTLNLRANENVSNNCLTQLTGLTHLNLSCNQWITGGCLGLLTNLRVLDLSYNESITNDALKHLTNLTSLALEDNSKITSLPPSLGEFSRARKFESVTGSPYR